MSYYTRSLLEATATDSFKSAIQIKPNTTSYSGVVNLTEGDSELGFWLFFGGTQEGAVKLVITVECAVVPHQETWSTVGTPLDFGAGEATAEISEVIKLYKPVAGDILPPYIRLKFVAGAGCTAKFTDIHKTVRGG